MQLSQNVFLCNGETGKNLRDYSFFFIPDDGNSPISRKNTTTAV